MDVIAGLYWALTQVLDVVAKMPSMGKSETGATVQTAVENLKVLLNAARNAAGNALGERDLDTRRRERSRLEEQLQLIAVKLEEFGNAMQSHASSLLPPLDDEKGWEAERPRLSSDHRFTILINWAQGIQSLTSSYIGELKAALKLSELSDPPPTAAVH